MEISKSETKATGLELLRQPFPENQISKKPQPYSKDSPKGKCAECGGFHGLPALHLDYVGHAALTDRLLDVDPNWNWEPLSYDANGCPFVDKDGGMWIKLTILGVTRLGYGDSGGKTGTNATKERIGDSLRNSGMRFGAALNLWHKGELHSVEDSPKKQEQPSFSEFAALLTTIESAATIPELRAAYAQAHKFALEDKLMISLFTKAKDLRKTQLTAEEAPNVVTQ
jgi:hypothetical protein